MIETCELIVPDTIKTVNLTKEMEAPDKFSFLRVH
jgi:hypothetical protein